MKNSILQLLAISLFTINFALTTSAQAPQGIPYQAIARNVSGVAIANTAVKVRFSIRDSIATGAIKYQETHNPTTSALGLFSVNVGMGTVVSGTFSGINWGKNAKFLQVELDPAGGSSYTDLGTTQMMSVPYALYSGTAGNLVDGASPYINPSSDSLMNLVGVSKLIEGTYTVPNNEIWKIVSITLPAGTAPTTYKIFLTGCQYISGSYECAYCNSTDLYSIKIGNYKYTEGVNYPCQRMYLSSCSECPAYIVSNFSGYNSTLGYKSIQMPLWANSGEQVSVGPLFVIYIEKYR
jgi:hypothetical protein